MIDPFDKMLWVYRAVFTQTAGAANVKVTFTFSERAVILYGIVGKDDYAAGRSISAKLLHGGAVVATVLESIAPDNERVPFPASGEGAAIDTDGANEFEKVVVVGKDDSLVIEASALATSETLTIQIRVLVGTRKPVVITTGSGGTVTIAVTYDKII